MAALAAGALVLAGCGSGGEGESPAELTASAAPPTPTATPLPQTGLETADAIVRAMAVGNHIGLGILMRAQSLPCTTAPGAGGPPKCFQAPGAPSNQPANGTIVDVFPLLACELEWRFSRAALAEELIVPDPALYAVVRMTRPLSEDPVVPAAEHAVIFMNAAFAIAGAEVVAAVRTCDAAAHPLTLFTPGAPFDAAEVVFEGEAFAVP